MTHMTRDKYEHMIVKNIKIVQLQNVCSFVSTVLSTVLLLSFVINKAHNVALGTTVPGIII